MEQKRKQFTIEQIAEEYEKHYCNLSKTAKALGVSRRAFIDWKEKEEDLRTALKDVEAGFIDRLEETAYTRAFETSDKLLMFMLERRAKDRGYGKEAEEIQFDKITVDLGEVITGEDIEKHPIVMTAEEYSKYEDMKSKGKAPATVAELEATFERPLLKAEGKTESATATTGKGIRFLG